MRKYILIKIPQMNPMNWLMLFFMFTFVFFITVVKLHFLFNE